MSDMARYIEGKALLNALKEERKKGNFVFTAKWIKEIIDDLPTADVVPKSEVERLETELKAMRGAANSYKMHYEKAKAEVAREIFEEMDNILDDYKLSERGLRFIRDGELSIDQRYAELKKKYSEETK